MKVCIIGAGPAGLTTIKQLLDEGHDVTCFEKNDNVGGIWYRHPADADEMKVFDDLILTISMKLMAFSDFMVEKERVFYTHRQYQQYLETYADKFRLRERVRFNTSIESVRKTTEGKWEVTTADRAGVKSKHAFDAVAICTGPFRIPSRDVQDLDKFEGEIVHSSRYRNNKRFSGKRTLVVGLAESGGDILREISDVASHCTLSIRSYSYLLPRLIEGMYATDTETGRANTYDVRSRVARVPFRMKTFFGDTWYSRALFFAVAGALGLAHIVANVVADALGKKKPPRKDHSTDAKNDLGETMFPKKIDTGTEWTQEHMQAINEWNRRAKGGSPAPVVIYCKSVRFIQNIVNGKITLNDVGIKSIRGRRVLFNDDTSQEFDTIVLCTGFKKDFSTLGDDVRVKDNNVRTLYKHAFYPEHEGRLAAIGFARPFTGGIPICAEMQARYFAQLCSGKIRLPEDVKDRIQEEKKWEETQVAMSPRHTEAIPSQILFCDSIAKEIGCLTPIPELILNPKLFVRHWLYPFNQSCYRLRGPHSMREVALEQMMNEKPGPLQTNLGVFSFVLSGILPRFMLPEQSFRERRPRPRPPSKPIGWCHALSPEWRARQATASKAATEPRLPQGSASVR